MKYIIFKSILYVDITMNKSRSGFDYVFLIAIHIDKSFVVFWALINPINCYITSGIYQVLFQLVRGRKCQFSLRLKLGLPLVTLVTAIRIQFSYCFIRDNWSFILVLLHLW